MLEVILVPVLVSLPLLDDEPLPPELTVADALLPLPAPADAVVVVVVVVDDGVAPAAVVPTGA